MGAIAAAAETMPLYRRTTWQKAIDENKIDMGLMVPFAQDHLDRDMVRAVIDNHHRGLREMATLGAQVNRVMTAPVAGTALHLAAARGALKTVVTLLQLGADPFLRDASGRTAREIAAARGADAGNGGGRIRTVLKLWEQRRLRASRAVNDDGSLDDVLRNIS